MAAEEPEPTHACTHCHAAPRAPGGLTPAEDNELEYHYHLFDRHGAEVREFIKEMDKEQGTVGGRRILPAYDNVLRQLAQRPEDGDLHWELSMILKALPWHNEDTDDEYEIPAARPGLKWMEQIVRDEIDFAQAPNLKDTDEYLVDAHPKHDAIRKIQKRVRTRKREKALRALKKQKYNTRVGSSRIRQMDDGSRRVVHPLPLGPMGVIGEYLGTDVIHHGGSHRTRKRTRTRRRKKKHLKKGTNSRGRKR